MAVFDGCFDSYKYFIILYFTAPVTAAKQLSVRQKKRFIASVPGSSGWRWTTTSAAASCDAGAGCPRGRAVGCRTAGPRPPRTRTPPRRSRSRARRTKKKTSGRTSFAES